MSILTIIAFLLQKVKEFSQNDIASKSWSLDMNQGSSILEPAFLSIVLDILLVSYHVTITDS